MVSGETFIKEVRELSRYTNKSQLKIKVRVGLHWSVVKKRISKRKESVKYIYLSIFYIEKHPFMKF